MENSYKTYLEQLTNRYQKSTINTDELAHELSVSRKTIELRVKENRNIPRYKRANGTRSRLIFPIVEVALFLANDLHEVR